MSLHRFIACQRLKLSARNINTLRWQSSNAAPKGGGAMKMIIIGVATTGLAAGGSLIYANYNPVFKNQVNERIPGFSSWADRTSDLWVSVTDYFHPNPKETGNRSGVLSPAKVQSQLEELKKTTPAVKKDVTKYPGTTDQMKSLGEKLDIKDTEQLKDGDKKERGKSKVVSSTDKKGVESKKPKESSNYFENVASEKSRNDELLLADTPTTSTKPSVSDPSSAKDKDPLLVGDPLSASDQVPASGPLPASDPSLQVTNSLQAGGLLPASDPLQAGDLLPASDPLQVGDLLPVTDPLQVGDQLPASDPLPAGDQSGLISPTEPAEEIVLSEKAEKIISELEEIASSSVSSERIDKPLSSLNKKIEVLEHELKELEIKHAQELKEELEELRKNLELLAGNALKYALEESEEKHQQNLATELNEMSSKYNDILREQYRLENESHTVEMDHALKSQADDLNSKWSEEMDLNLSKKEGQYQVELAKSRARLGGLERTVDIVAVAGEKTFQLQRLRNSCDSLITAFEDLDLNSDITDRHTLGTELKSLHTAAHRDPFITTVLDSIPQQAVDGEGIQSKASLGERFRRVKRVCRRVALVPETGGGIGTYALSYIQSTLTLKAWFPGEKIEDSKPDLLHAFDLLHLAEAKLKRGDLEGAVHYMNHLQGEPKRVARDWMVDARSYLETRQAIQLVQTYMSANAVTNANQ